jgi:hypothetical protein
VRYMVCGLVVGLRSAVPCRTSGEPSWPRWPE